MSELLWTVVSEGTSAQAAFDLAKQSAQQRGDVEDGVFVRSSYVILDPTTLFPTDGLAAARAEDAFGMWPQAGAQPIVGPRSPMCYAIRIRPQRVGGTRLLFFGTRRPSPLAANVTLPLPTLPSWPDGTRNPIY